MKTFAARPHWLALGLVAAAAGCNSRPPATVSQQVSKQTDPFEELAQSIRDDFRKPADTAVSRRVVEQVNNQLSRGGERRPAGLSAEDRSQLQKELGLRPQEVVELGRTEF